MKASYTNLQRYDVSSMFPVAQRRIGWLLRQQPRKFSRPRGSRWRLIARGPITESTDAELAAAVQSAREGFVTAATLVQHLAREQHRRGISAETP
jgi:hypothetical protein